MSDKKVDYVEIKQGKPQKNPINQIMLIVLVMFCAFLLIYNLNKVPAELKADPLASDYLQCRELWNDTKDKHTRACCDTCNKIKLDYAFDVQYQTGDAIIDKCVCVDAWRNQVLTVWD